jgi:mannose-6-phosphate isomerase-like protein (cupin superfamily)
VLAKVNLSEQADSVSGLFEYLQVGRLNDHVLNVLQAENRTLGFHIHEHSDELFYVIEGAFELEFDDGLVPLSQGDMLIIPKGTRHRPVVRELVKCLLIELGGTLTAENTGGTYRE